LTSGTQARADRRVLMSAALTGSGIGLALGAAYLAAGLGQAVADHSRAARIAQETDGGFSETMLQREMDRMDPTALRLARSHDALADSQTAVQPGARQPGGRKSASVDRARQLNCLTEAVYFEARGETPRGQAAVAQVVMNRVKSPSFPKTVCAVVFQGAAGRGCQFSFACDGSMRHGLEAGAWDRARRIAERALTGRVLADIGNATHFHVASIQPDWSGLIKVAQVGTHIFYKFGPRPVAAVAKRAVEVEPAIEAYVEPKVAAQAAPPQVILASVTAPVPVKADAPVTVAKPETMKTETAKPAL